MVAAGDRVRLVGADYPSGAGVYGYRRYVGQVGTVVAPPFRFGSLMVVEVDLDMPDGPPLRQTVEVRHLQRQEVPA